MATISCRSSSAIQWNIRHPSIALAGIWNYLDSLRNSRTFLDVFDWTPPGVWSSQVRRCDWPSAMRRVFPLACHAHAYCFRQIECCGIAAMHPWRWVAERRAYARRPHAKEMAPERTVSQCIWNCCSTRLESVNHLRTNRDRTTTTFRSAISARYFEWVVWRMAPDRSICKSQLKKVYGLYLAHKVCWNPAVVSTLDRFRAVSSYSLLNFPVERKRKCRLILCWLRCKVSIFIQIEQVEGSTVSARFIIILSHLGSDINCENTLSCHSERTIRTILSNKYFMCTITFPFPWIFLIAQWHTFQS